MPSFAILLASASSCFAVSSIRSASALDRSSEKIWTKGRGEWRVRCEARRREAGDERHVMREVRVCEMEAPNTHLDETLAVRRRGDRRPRDFELAFALQLALLFGIDRRE